MKKTLTLLAAALFSISAADANWSKKSIRNFNYVVGTFEPSLESPVYTTIEYHCGSDNSYQAVNIRLQEVERLFDEPQKLIELDQHLKYPIVIFNFDGYEQYKVRGIIDETLSSTVYLGTTNSVANEIALVIKEQLLSVNTFRLSIQTLHGYFHTDIDTSGFTDIYKELCE